MNSSPFVEYRLLFFLLYNQQQRRAMLDPLWREVCHRYYYASSSPSGREATTDGNIHAHRKIIQQRFSLSLSSYRASYIQKKKDEKKDQENKTVKKTRKNNN